ncbi:MAG: cupin domain-containing protein [Gammaproteobacteria bacterium]|nr:cupin domain-containing protein [Gammaproteobacteria bacterium]
MTVRIPLKTDLLNPMPVGLFICVALLVVFGNSIRADGGSLYNPIDSVRTITQSELIWTPLNPREPNGVAMATLWGDPFGGSYGALLRVPAGFESPMHTHSVGERIVQLKGTSVHWLPGESKLNAQVLEPGDYFQMPANMAHVSATQELESLELIIQEGPFDFALVEPINFSAQSAADK